MCNHVIEKESLKFKDLELSESKKSNHFSGHALGPVDTHFSVMTVAVRLIMAAKLRVRFWSVAIYCDLPKGQRIHESVFRTI